MPKDRRTTRGIIDVGQVCNLSIQDAILPQGVISRTFELSLIICQQIA
jgi:hypothetical protein